MGPASLLVRQWNRKSQTPESPAWSPFAPFSFPATAPAPPESPPGATSRPKLVDLVADKTALEARVERLVEDLKKARDEFKGLEEEKESLEEEVEELQMKVRGPHCGLVTERWASRVIAGADRYPHSQCRRARGLRFLT